MDAKDLAAVDQTVKPNANETILRVLDIPGDVTLTLDGSESFPGDKIIILASATAAGSVIIAGDGAPGSLAIGAGGVGAAILVNGGTEETPFFVSSVPLT